MNNKKIFNLVVAVIVACFGLLGYVIYLVTYGHQKVPGV
jgi:ATP/ADP translocase